MISPNTEGRVRRWNGFDVSVRPTQTQIVTRPYVLTNPKHLIQ